MSIDTPKEEIENNAISKKTSKDDGRIHENKNIARICFTELKLSQARQHAFEYGRLGIGVKRCYLLDRKGQPVIYLMNIKNRTNTWFDSFDNNNNNQFLEAQKSFFKKMSYAEDLNFKYYSESEWRIVYANSLKNLVPTSFDDLYINVRSDTLDSEYRKYDEIYQNRKQKTPFSSKEFMDFINKSIEKNNRLQYLLPLDYWLSVIIYPCPAVKIIAERDCEIRRLLRKTRVRNNLTTECLASNNIGEQYMLPMEIDLDTISHF